jgi:hypothetical protein
MGKRNYVEILSVSTPAGVKNNYQDIVGMVLPTTGNAYHGIKVVTPNGTERDIFHYNVGKMISKEENAPAELSSADRILRTTTELPDFWAKESYNEDLL